MQDNELTQRNRSKDSIGCITPRIGSSSRDPEANRTDYLPGVFPKPPQIFAVIFDVRYKRGHLEIVVWRQFLELRECGANRYQEGGHFRPKLGQRRHSTFTLQGCV